MKTIYLLIFITCISAYGATPRFGDGGVARDPVPASPVRAETVQIIELRIQALDAWLDLTKESYTTLMQKTVHEAITGARDLQEDRVGVVCMINSTPSGAFTRADGKVQMLDAPSMETLYIKAGYDPRTIRRVSAYIDRTSTGVSYTLTVVSVKKL